MSVPVTLESPREVEVTMARRFDWAVRREIWENRSIYLAPLAVAIVILIGSSIGLVGLPDRIRAAAAMSPMQQHEVIERPFVSAALMLMAIEMLVAMLYSLDALYGEHRDRSILFWKSLPVSDATTVLAKASIPILVLPLVTFALTVVTQLLMLLMSSAVLAGSGMSPSILWTHVSIFKFAGINLFHMVGFHGIWYAPLYGWLLLVSAWARRAPFLWATLPPFAIGVVEKVAFNTSHFALMLQQHFFGDPTAMPAGKMTMEMMTPGSAAAFLGSPGLWIGLAITAVFLMAAVRQRRSREAI